MTSAEKIRQVVERHTKVLHDCTVSGDIVADKKVVLAQVAKNSHRVVSVAILSAIIEEMEKCAGYHTRMIADCETREEQVGHIAAKTALEEQTRVLKEARTSITNSTNG